MQHNEASMKLVLIWILVYSSYTKKNFTFTKQNLEKSIWFSFDQVCLNEADDGWRAESVQAT